MVEDCMLSREALFRAVTMYSAGVGNRGGGGRGWMGGPCVHNIHDRKNITVVHCKDLEQHTAQSCSFKVYVVRTCTTIKYPEFQFWRPSIPICLGN